MFGSFIYNICSPFICTYLFSLESLFESIMKTKTLKQKIDAILRKYWFDPYAKEEYIKNCTKKLVDLIDHELAIIQSERQANGV